ncbi:MAG TPA: Gfo/Idh/MocA family oxidoreductase [Planctomycetota bacterium]|nr:Gfo/Idh/MocA family oxidoreductase [Planctomycetota bacterium]
MNPSRRHFLAVGAAAALPVPLVHAGGGDRLRVGLIGCGGRGTGAAAQAMNADPNVSLVAMGDLYEDRLKASLKSLSAEGAGKVDVPPERQFTGFDAYKGVIEHSDVVLLCEPPHFRPRHLKAAVEAGKHVFAEKPVAVDAPGVRSVLASCEEARRRRLSVVSGLCLRYSDRFREAMKRVHGGAIGRPVAVQANDWRGGRWARPREEGWDDMTWQTRNWYNFTWLSGDFNVEQHVHFLDVAAWALGDRYPARAIGMGGRQVFTGPEYGNIYDHFSVVYEYDDGTRLTSHTRQHGGCANDISCQVLGTEGRAHLTTAVVKVGDWSPEGKGNSYFQEEHNVLFASIRRGEPVNNGEYMSKSTLLAIMGRMAAYTGQRITWEQAMGSKEDLTPPAYAWGPHPVPGPAVPGKTRFF